MIDDSWSLFCRFQGWLVESSELHNKREYNNFMVNEMWTPYTSSG